LRENIKSCTKKENRAGGGGDRKEIKESVPVRTKQNSFEARWGKRENEIDLDA